MAKQKRRADWVNDAERLGIEVPPSATVKEIKKMIDRKSPPTEEQLTLGQALISHPQHKVLRRYFGMKDAKWRTGLTADEIEEGKALCEELNLPIPK